MYYNLNCDIKYEILIVDDKNQKLNFYLKVKQEIFCLKDSKPFATNLDRIFATIIPFTKSIYWIVLLIDHIDTISMSTI